MNLLRKIKNIFCDGCFRKIENDISYEKLQQIINQNNNVYLIDVRTKDEFLDKHLKNAINIPLQNIEKNIENIVKNKDDIIIVYCKYGSRGEKALNKLAKMGYKNIYNLKGGIMGI